MKLHEYIDEKQNDAYCEGWNYACNHGFSDGKIVQPKTSKTGMLRESFLAGFSDAIDRMLLERKTPTPPIC